MQKNVAGQKWIVFAFNVTDNEPVPGDAANITAEISADGAAGGGNIADTNPTEIEDGYYAFDVTQGESNGDLLLILPESSTPDVQLIGVPGSVYTTEPNRNKLSVDGNGVVKSDLTNIKGTVLTETAGQLAARFKDFFDQDAAGFNIKTALSAFKATSVTVSDKTGFSLSTAGILAIWDQATSALTTAGRIGKLLVDNINAAITSRATSSKQNSMETTLGEVKVQTTRVDGLIEDSGGDRFTEKSLEQAPSGGGGGDATESNQNTIIDLLEADSEIKDDNPAQHQRVMTKKGTATVLVTKDLFKPDGDPVTSISDVISQEVEA